jgi:hypothetical protein|tara:strand:- start:131 stop:367 length:237 start_codon:yes stop_codon:yes gene_type:complete
LNSHWCFISSLLLSPTKLKAIGEKVNFFITLIFLFQGFSVPSPIETTQITIGNYNHSLDNKDDKDVTLTCMLSEQENR